MTCSLGSIFRLFNRLKEEFRFVHGNVLVLMTVWAVADFAYLLPDAYYSLYVEALGASAFLIGAIVSVSSVAMAFFQLAGGYMADKYGRRFLIVSMSFARALIFLVFATAPSWHFILLGEVMVGVSTISQPALSAIVADSLPSHKRGIGYSLTIIAGVTSIFSPLVAGFLYLRFNLVLGMRIAYLIVSGCYFVSGTMFLRLTETLKRKENHASIKEAFRDYPKAIKECLTIPKIISKQMLNLILIFTPIMFVVRMCIPYYALYAIHVLEIEEFQWAMLQMWSSIVLYAALLPIGKIADVYGRKKLLVLSSIFAVLALSFFLYGNLFRLYIFFTFSALCNALVFIAYPSLQADLTSKEHRGKVIGFTSFLDCICGSAALLLGGFLYENVAPATPFLLQMIVMAIAAIATMIFIKEPKTRAE